MYICIIKLKDIKTDRFHINKLSSQFKNHSFFSTKDIAAFYREFDANIKQTTINWRVYTLIEMGVLSRIGRGKFILGRTKVFHPEITTKLKSVYNKLMKEFPYVEICIWNTSILNEFMKHQPGVFYFIIEVEKDVTQSVFYFLKELKLPVFIEPTRDIIEKYLPIDKEAFIIKPLVSESPTQTVNGITTISIEKLLVDIFCDDVVFSAQQGSEMRTIFNEAFSKYTVNLSKMLRYANRRRKKEPFEEYLSTLQIYGSKASNAAKL